MFRKSYVARNNTFNVKKPALNEYHGRNQDL